MNPAEVLHDEIKVAAEVEGRKTTRVSQKSPGMGRAANERDAKSMIFASPVSPASPSKGREFREQSTKRRRGEGASSGELK